MNDLVNNITRINNALAPSGIFIQLDGEQAHLVGPLVSSCLRLVSLYRPSARDIEREAAPDVLLALTSPSHKALEVAAKTNYLALPHGSIRIMVPGIALVLDAAPSATRAARQVHLTGRTGVVAETLLLGGTKTWWSVRELAKASDVSPALAHRVLARLELEGLLLAKGSGPEKVRAVSNLRGLAELWSEEEKKSPCVLRGFLYGAALETLARKVLDIYPDGALGGTLAANLYKPTLTRVLPPLRLWVGQGFDPAPLLALGFERTDEGANIEFMQSKDDPWRVHRNRESLPMVSKARAWLEVSSASGRTQELAEALLEELGGQEAWKS